MPKPIPGMTDFVKQSQEFPKRENQERSEKTYNNQTAIYSIYDDVDPKEVARILGVR